MSTFNNNRPGGFGVPDLAALLARRVVGQPAATASIVPYVRLHQAGLAPEGRPAGVFLLLGPSGTGKTRTVEALAEVLHGSERNVLRVDCGEFQMEHEVAKLTGAPPGYLGHRETHPLLTQQKLNAVTSERSNLSLVLFDEIEKAAPSLNRLLLGVLDKASLRLGDNTHVNFERSLIFLTSNLGARDMLSYLKPAFGFGAGEKPCGSEVGEKLQAIGLAAVRRKFAPEFVNRLDTVITYQPLSAAMLDEIVELQLADVQQLIRKRLGTRSFQLRPTRAARRFLIERGASQEYGARELKRTIHRQLVHPLGELVADNAVPPQSTVHIDVARDKGKLRFRITRSPLQLVRPAA